MRINELFEIKLYELETILDLTGEQRNKLNDWFRRNFDTLQIQKIIDREDRLYLKNNKDYMKYEDKKVANEIGNSIFEEGLMIKENSPSAFGGEQTIYGVLVLKVDNT